MNLLFLNPPFGAQRPEGLDAPLGIMSLGAVLKARGHACRLVDHVWEQPDDWSKWEQELAARPDAVLINTQIRFSAETGEALRRARHAAPDLPCLAFGPQASTEPARLLELGFDAAVVGEPENLVPNLLEVESFRQGQARFCGEDVAGVKPALPPEGSAGFTPAIGPIGAGRLGKTTGWPAMAGLATAANPAPGFAPRVDVEQLPFPDWDLADYRRYIQTTHNAVVMASRGLNTPDAFNQPPLIYALAPTRRCSVARVLRELTELRRRFPEPYLVLFHDEIFTEDRSWVLELCAGLRPAALDLSFWCFTRPELLDPELCLHLRRSGFVGVSLGMESGADRILRRLERGLTTAQIEAGFRAAHAAGLLTIGSVMLGTPGTPEEPDETPAELELTRRLIRRVEPDVLTVTLTTPLPGTLLWEQTAARRLARTPSDFNYYHTWPGKYPVQLQKLTPDSLTDAVGAMRGAWKRGLWKTAFRLLRLGCRNAAFRKTLRAQALKVLRRKLAPRRD